MHGTNRYSHEQGWFPARWALCLSIPKVGLQQHGKGYAPEDDIHALQNLSENDVPAVEPAARSRREEELTTVGIRARIGHAQYLDGERHQFFGR